MYFSVCLKLNAKDVLGAQDLLFDLLFDYLIIYCSMRLVFFTLAQVTMLVTYRDLLAPIPIYKLSDYVR